MKAYSDFAYVYDRLMCDVDYEARTEYILKLFNKYGKKPSLLLDLACGTGGFSVQMAKHGIEVIGVDMSEEMLGMARENAIDSGSDVLFLCQRAEELDLYGTVDGAICCMDSLNHITDIKDLEKAVSKVSLFLEEDCLFIFDVNTVYKHEKVLGDNTFVIDEDGVYCVWQNEYDPTTKITNIMLDFFVETEDGAYERFGEDFCERAYTREELKCILEQSGLTLLAVLGDMTECEPESCCEREIYIAKKKG
ncbi:MAG: class I SAM-dependent methyltransferase [Clostridia bacterium]|nr:class I SAM-dependent methyltransferase [Clostridia bacterium]